MRRISRGFCCPALLCTSRPIIFRPPIWIAENLISKIYPLHPLIGISRRVLVGVIQKCEPPVCGVDNFRVSRWMDLEYFV